MTAETKTGRGKPPQKWPFFQTLKVNHFAEVKDVSKYSALRTAASRAGVKLKRKFTVSKEDVEENNGERGEIHVPAHQVLRVYRTK